MERKPLKIRKKLRKRQKLRKSKSYSQPSVTKIWQELMEAKLLGLLDDKEWSTIKSVSKAARNSVSVLLMNQNWGQRSRNSFSRLLAHRWWTWESQGRQLVTSRLYSIRAFWVKLFSSFQMMVNKLQLKKAPIRLLKLTKSEASKRNLECKTSSRSSVRTLINFWKSRSGI